MTRNLRIAPCLLLCGCTDNSGTEPPNPGGDCAYLGNAAIDWNAGGAYSAEADGAPYLLVPATDYSATTVYRLDAVGPARVFDTPGWSTLLFELAPGGDS